MVFVFRSSEHIQYDTEQYETHMQASQPSSEKGFSWERSTMACLARNRMGGVSPWPLPFLLLNLVFLKNRQSGSLPSVAKLRNSETSGRFRFLREPSLGRWSYSPQRYLHLGSVHGVSKVGVSCAEPRTIVLFSCVWCSTVFCFIPMNYWTVVVCCTVCSVLHCVL